MLQSINLCFQHFGILRNISHRKEEQHYTFTNKHLKQIKFKFTIQKIRTASNIYLFSFQFHYQTHLFLK